MEDQRTENCEAGRKEEEDSECLICALYYSSQTFYARSIVDSTDVCRKSANRWATNQKISQYCLSSALNSNVKQPQDGSPQLHPGPHKHFWRGTWRCWHTGPHHGEGGWGFWHRLWASVCKVTAASSVAPTASSGTVAVRVLLRRPAGGEASQLPCDGSFRQRVSTCHQPSPQL